MHDKRKPYPELPYPWTIAREGGGPFHDDLFYGLNTVTGQETDRYPTYGLALKQVEYLEVMAKIKILRS